MGQVGLYLQSLRSNFFPLPRNLAKTDYLSWHNFLCLSFLVLWVRVEPGLGFSFTQGFSLWLLHFTQSYSEPDLPIHTGIKGHGPGPQKGSQNLRFLLITILIFFFFYSWVFPFFFCNSAMHSKQMCPIIQYLKNGIGFSDYLCVVS